MHRQSSATALDRLWGSAPWGKDTFGTACPKAREIPEPARRYLQHAIAPGTPRATTVRLLMHGDFRRGKWRPFTAEQVIRADGEMLWCAAMRLYGLPVKGFDRVLGGEGAMQWKVGFVPLVNASGPDITRSAIGRVVGESVWLPSLLSADSVTWTSTGPSHAQARFTLLGERTELDLAVADTGRLESIRYLRWGNPEGSSFHYVSFGGTVEEERTFGGYTIPTRLRVGWYVGSPRFEAEGEFFRVTIDEATFR